MRIRTKLLSLVLLVAGGFILLSVISVRTYIRLDSMKSAIDQGIRLIAQSRRSHGLMKDVVFDLFSPRVYSSLQGIVLSARSLTTQKEWNDSVAEFRSSYTSFMANPEIAKLLADEELREAYTVAGPMSERAFKEIEELRGIFERIRSRYPDENELYRRLQLSKDESVYAVFDRVRSASFYLGNIFESYLNRFVGGLERQSQAIERQIIIAYALASALVIALAAAGVFLMTRSILTNLRLVEGAVERLSEGDFSLRVAPRGHDEIGRLAERVNLFAERLKHNVDSLTALLGEVNLAVPEAPELDRILAIVTDALLRDKSAECAAVYLLEGGRAGRSAWSGFPPLPGDSPADGLVETCASVGAAIIVRDVEAEAFPLADYGLDPTLRSLLVVPMNVHRRLSGVCLFGRRSRVFTDLELTQLVSFADYAAQVVDNAVANAALRARSDAEYQALQSQIQPHFIYNVLNGLVALNRMGERQVLELSLHALKDMLRYTLEHDRWAAVTEEFSFLERYCRLQKLRFEERLSYEFLLEPGVAALRIPKLLVQPLVENAMIHGVEPSAFPTRVLISARVDDVVLLLKVEDDGAGCDPASIAEKERLGLGNVRERLGLVYRGASLSLSGAKGKGFAVELRIPLEEVVAL